jgi:hypothetical protein
MLQSLAINSKFQVTCMTVVFRQATYRIPGVYQWVKPSTAIGAGPFGSTYLQTIVTVIGAGSGGGSGISHVGVGAGGQGGNGGNGGGYGQATYLPGALNSLENIVVGMGTPGSASNAHSATVSGQIGSVDSNTAGLSSFGAHINCNGGTTSNGDTGGVSTVTGGSNITSNRGGANIADNTNILTQLSTGPGVLNQGAQITWQPTGNNAGGSGGCNFIGTNVVGGNGGGVNFLGGGLGATNSAAAAQPGFTPGAAGGCSFTQGSFVVTPGILVTGGNGANASPNTGAGGGGGGAAVIADFGSTGTLCTSGAGGNGSNGAVQITDVFSFPNPLPPIYFNLSGVAYFNMMNMARPVSITGAYLS